jgi:P-loop Domain of unknown function (DUF2791)
MTANAIPFKYWPFDIVPRPGAPLSWADRSRLRQQIEQLGRRLGRHQAASLHLLWADFGAGKTHTLLFLKQEAEAGKYGGVLPLYSALPKGSRTFIDIYRAMVRGIPRGVLQNAYHAATKVLGTERVERELAHSWSNMTRCIQAIAIGSDIQQETALAWLHAEPGINARDVHDLSLVGRIRSTDDAVLALCGVVQLFGLAGFRRTLFMVDEFQRVETLRRQQQDEINAGLHSFFNASGQGMSLLLSFSFGVEANLRHFLNQELLSRADPLRISIPALSLTEAEEFLQAVLEQARDPTEHWPVDPDVVATIVRHVASRFELTPRRVVKAAGLVFELAELDLEDGAIGTLNAKYVDDMADRGDFMRIDEKDDPDAIS